MTIPDPPNQLNVVRGLGLAAAVSVVIGWMVGQGVFLKTRVMTCNVETPEMVITVWVVAGLLVMAGGLSFAELGTMMPRSGGPYVFLLEAYGPLVSFLYGWQTFAIATTGQTVLGVAFAIFLNVISGGALSGDLFSFGLAGSTFSITYIQLVAVLVIMVVMVVNCAPVSFSGHVITGFSSFKVALVLAVAAGAFFVADGNWMHFAESAASGSCEGVSASTRGGGSSGFGAAMLGALLAYNGWQAIVFLGGEVRNPAKLIPIAVIGGVSVVIALYVLINVAYFYVLSPSEVASVSVTSSVGTETIAKFLGPTASKLMAAALLVSCLGTMQVAGMAQPRAIFALARDGLFFKRVGEVSKTSRVPMNAVIAYSVWAMVIVFFGSYDTLTDFYMFTGWFFWLLVGATVFVFRRTRPDAVRPYRTLGYPIVPALFVMVAASILLNTVMTKPTQSLIGLAVIAAGLPLYWYRQRRGHVDRLRSEKGN